MIPRRWKFGTPGLILRTLHTRLFGVSDRERWEDLRYHDVAWDQRTRAIADLIPPGSRVIEFGAGRRQLERWLPDGCSYTPSDIVERGSGTFLCDLNRRPLPFLERNASVQTAVFSGVIEYIVDLPTVLAWLAPQIDWIVASYHCAPQVDRAAKRLRIIAARLPSGWVNDFTEVGFVGYFKKANFALSRIVHGGAEGEQIFVFSRGT